jgi:hypothetical protein
MNQVSLRIVGTSISLAAALALVGCAASQPPQPEVKVEDVLQRAETYISQMIAQTDAARPMPRFLTWSLKGDFCKSSNPGAPSIFAEASYYNPLASARMCDPVLPGAPVRLYDSGVLKWWTQNGMQDSMINRAFNVGSMAVAPIFEVVQWEHPNPERIKTNFITNGQQDFQHRWVSVPSTLETEVVGKPNICFEHPLQARSQAAPQPGQLALDEFFWVQVRKPKENPDITPAKCGDIFVLVGMNLMVKEATGWLWATLWWSDNTPQPGERRLTLVDHAAGNPNAWKHYVVNAMTGSDAVLFNPYKTGREDPGTNCQYCHERGAAFGARSEPHGKGSQPPIGSPALHTDLVFAPANLEQSN